MPISENDPSDSADLLDMKDVKLEVTRSRGAGGQVSPQSARTESNALLTQTHRPDQSHSMSTRPNPLCDLLIFQLASRSLCRTQEVSNRWTYLPSLYRVEYCLKELSDLEQNRDKAFRVLRARLLDHALQKERAERRDFRRSQVRGNDRSEKVRTYNVPQDRVTDHRIGLTMSGIEAMLEGQSDTLELIGRELVRADEEERLEALLEESSS
jgi:protein subunit release factor A